MKTPRRNRILMLVENNAYSIDIRVIHEVQALLSAGYQVSVISPALSGQSLHEEIDGVHFFRFPAPSPMNTFLGYIWEYGYSLVATFVISCFACFHPGFDIIHAANPPDTMVFIAGFYKLFGKRFIFDHHDLAPELYYARYGKKGHASIHRILLWLEKVSCHIADHIITTNQSYKEIEMQRDHVKEERITIVRNGPDRWMDLIEPEPGLSQHGKKNLVYVGVIGIQDGVDYLIRALYHMVYQLGIKDFLCTIVGDGDALHDIKALSVELGLSEYVLFTGWVDGVQVPRYLNAADICIAPEPSDPYNDRCTTIKMMEYMVMGKPVVAFDLPENRLTAQNAALYASPNDELDFARQIVALMEDPERRARMGRLGRERIETGLAWKYQEKYLLEAYEILAHCDS